MPTRGTTWWFYEYVINTVISIHVPTRGTTWMLLCQLPTMNFNPRAHEGHDVLSPADYLVEEISIHVPTRGTTKCRF